MPAATESSQAPREATISIAQAPSLYFWARTDTLPADPTGILFARQRLIEIDVLNSKGDPVARPS